MQVMNNFVITEESSKTEAPSNIGIYVPSQETEVVCAKVSKDQKCFLESDKDKLERLKDKKVYFHRGHGLPITYDGKKYLAVKMEDIICCSE